MYSVWRATRITWGCIFLFIPRFCVCACVLCKYEFYHLSEMFIMEIYFCKPKLRFLKYVFLSLIQGLSHLMLSVKFLCWEKLRSEISSSHHSMYEDNCLPGCCGLAEVDWFIRGAYCFNHQGLISLLLEAVSTSDISMRLHGATSQKAVFFKSCIVCSCVWIVILFALYL